MKLSTKGRYGLKAVVDLAAVTRGSTMTLAQLAASQGVSQAYLERILRTLRTSGIVETVRGASGGYALSVSPETLSVECVLRALEGTTAVVDCVGTAGKGCESACVCAARPLFLTLQHRINDVLRETTIQDLLNENLEQKRRLEHAANLS